MLIISRLEGFFPDSLVFLPFHNVKKTVSIFGDQKCTIFGFWVGIPEHSTSQAQGNRVAGLDLYVS